MSIAEIQELNNTLIEKINQEGLTNPQSPYAGKWVGVANGKVVAVADTADEVDRELDKIEPDPARVRLIEASRDYSVEEYIWESVDLVRRFRLSYWLFPSQTSPRILILGPWKKTRWAVSPKAEFPSVLAELVDPKALFFAFRHYPLS